jgi:hypothetical protein
MSVGKVIRRAWSRRGPTDRKVKVVSYGFTVQIDSKQVKRFNAEWTEDIARDELAKFVLDREKPKAKPVTFAEAAKRYEDAKARKRSLREDKKTLKRLLAHFGADTKLDRLSADVISQYQRPAVRNRIEESQRQGRQAAGPERGCGQSRTSAAPASAASGSRGMGCAGRRPENPA